MTRRIHEYIHNLNQNARPFTRTATADNILAKVRCAQTNIKQLVDNNQQ